MPKATERENKKKDIYIKGANEHNLKNVDVIIPRNKFTVITGLSGSGKSSLAFDTLYAEGQRRYVESLSSYARQFLGKLDKPNVEQIRGISPAIAIEQKVISRNPRSTVGTNTEIFDYLKLLFARIGKTFSPVSGKEVKRDTVKDVITFINQFEKGTKAILYSPLQIPEERSIQKHLDILKQQGFTRIRVDNKVQKIDELLSDKAIHDQNIDIVIDRFTVDPENDENTSRIADSVESAFFEGKGNCLVELFTSPDHTFKTFSDKFEEDGIPFEVPSVHFFSFNNPLGACPTCEGFGKVIGIDEDLVIPNKSLSIFEGAIICWKGEKMGKWKEKLINNADKFDFPIHRPYYDLSAEQKQLIWSGNKYFKGLNAFFKHLESKMYKIQYRVMLSRYRGKTTCPECQGTRLRKDANYVKVGGRSITDLTTVSLWKCYDFFKGLKLNDHDNQIAGRLVLEVKNRLEFLIDVGLGYLTLNRLSNTLSGGESQRINLATSLGSSLVGSMYILDEPSIGLHPRDTKRLIKVLKRLRDLGNTVVVVEHEEEIMKAADFLIDMGPFAGSHGGEVVFTGTHQQLESAETLTAKYLTGRDAIPVPQSRRRAKDFIEIKGARQFNLKGIDVKIPLHALSVITGVSGSGKSTLVRSILYPSLKKSFGGHSEKPGTHDSIEGDFKKITQVEFVDQNPIGKSSRSNPVTYVKAFDEIRNLFSRQQLSKINGFKPSHFSFNVPGGRCDVCEGEGAVTVEMQFMADVHLLCEACKGKRYKEEILEVEYQGKNIYDILSMTIEDAIEFFSQDQEQTLVNKLIEKIKPLYEVGLGYVQLGQSSSTLSGGEAQRIKLASFLGKNNPSEHILFIFDEPTTGLHFYDIRKLLKAFNALIAQGHSVLVIEHNTDVIKCADWVIDLGPEGGDKGGHLVYEGEPEGLTEMENSYTGKFLKEKLDN